jgi:ATP-dependent exoDNAse (exonuclease V) alpha subunit
MTTTSYNNPFQKVVAHKNQTGHSARIECPTQMQRKDVTKLINKINHNWFECYEIGNNVKF